MPEHIPGLEPEIEVTVTSAPLRYERCGSEEDSEPVLTCPEVNLLARIEVTGTYAPLLNLCSCVVASEKQCIPDGNACGFLSPPISGTEVPVQKYPALLRTAVGPMSPAGRK